jgi:DNA modification methylase
MRTLPADCIHVAVTSPPYYGLRDYGCEGQIGLEDTPEEYVAKMVDVFREVCRVLHPSGSLWLNLGDSYNAYNGNRGKSTSFQSATEEACPAIPQGHGLTVKTLKPKDLIGIPWMVAFALRADGWYLRQWCPWVKRNPMPESATDRPGTACETVFLLAKRSDYFFDMEAVKRVAREDWSGEDFLPNSAKDKSAPKRTAAASASRANGSPDSLQSRNFRSSDLWFDTAGMMLAGKHPDPELLGFDVTLKAYKGAHFAVMPKRLIEPCILAGTSAKGVCPACGEPWVRLVKSERKATRPGKDTKVAATCAPGRGHAQSAVCGNRDPERHITTTETVGWEPGCACDVGEPVPAVVLDPFAGSGTVLSVAMEHGRRALGCELNPEYIRLIEKRMRSTKQPLFA